MNLRLTDLFEIELLIMNVVARLKNDICNTILRSA